MRPYLRGDVLEVGAGLGANTRVLRAGVANVRRWVCLEPDSRLFEQLRKSNGGSNHIECHLGTVGSLAPNERFDAILYIDVLEHIEDDAAEVRRAAARLRQDGYLIVLSPAHPWLFSAFDQSIGHYRRYTRTSLRKTAEAIDRLRLERSWYLDSCGLFASAANRILLRQSLPTLRQVLFWDRILVPMSRVVDPVLMHGFGKSVLAIWRRE